MSLIEGHLKWKIYTVVEVSLYKQIQIPIFWNIHFFAIEYCSYKLLKPEQCNWTLSCKATEVQNSLILTQITWLENLCFFANVCIAVQSFFLLFSISTNWNIYMWSKVIGSSCNRNVCNVQVHVFMISVSIPARNCMLPYYM